MMRFRFFTVLLTALLSVSAYAQQASNTAYAITSETKGGMEWTEVKLINLDNGEVIANVFENNHKNYTVFDARSFKKIHPAATTDSTTDDSRPFSGFSAACAYDKKLNRLYYTPIFINQLRYIDLNTAAPGVFIFSKQSFSNADTRETESSHMTRMVIASDGNGYALNNDGSHLVRFTTDKIPVITDLGSLGDATQNGVVSVKDANTSWGGDLVADASGNIYIITAHNFVFKVEVSTRIATYITAIKNLPEGFTTNGAVVDEAGKIVLSSASSITGYFRVDPRSWQASPIPSKEQVYNTSDLANDNFLFRTSLSPAQISVADGKIELYPNPVLNNRFHIRFAAGKEETYTVQVKDLGGRTVSVRPVPVNSYGQQTEVRVDPYLARGLYAVKVLNQAGTEVFIRKILLR